MLWLAIVSLVWPLSFGLIGHVLKGVDPNLAACARLAVSFLVFLPFLRWRRLSLRTALRLAAVGAVQYGLMYLAYFHSFRFFACQSHLVAVFTAFTPLYVMVLHDVSRRGISRIAFATAALATAGAAVAVLSQGSPTWALKGFLLVQASNVCFAAGQVWYRNIMGTQNDPSTPTGTTGGRGDGLKDAEVFALLYLGAVVVTAIPVALRTDWSAVRLSSAQIWTLLYLAVIPSGVCFFLWNVGARRTGAGTLAAFNNAKIPLAVVFSILIWKEPADLLQLALGGTLVVLAIFASEWFSRRLKRQGD